MAFRVSTQHTVLTADPGLTVVEGYSEPELLFVEVDGQGVEERGGWVGGGCPG